MKAGLQQGTSAFQSNVSLYKAPNYQQNGFCSSEVSKKQKSLFEKLKFDKKYRSKIIRTCIIGWTFLFLGWSIGIFGPCFPDLMLILDKDLETASWLFTVGAFGYLVGSMLGGIAYDRYNTLLLLSVSVVGMAITNGAIPWCNKYPLMLMMTFLCSTFEGSIETGGNADIVSLWGAECSPFMLGIHFAYSAGGIISPFVTQPFLAEKKCLNFTNGTKEKLPYFAEQNFFNQTVDGTNSHGSIFNMYKDNFSLANKISEGINSYLVAANDSVDVIVSGYLLANKSETSIRNTTCIKTYGKTNIHFSFLIAAVLSLSAAIPLFILFLSSDLQYTKDKSTTMNVEQSEQALNRRPECLPLRLKILCLMLLSILMFLYNAIEDDFTGLLMMFSISHLGWSKSSGSLATSVEWASFASGRFVGIFLVRCITTRMLLTLHLVTLTISLIGFLISSLTMQTYLVWVFVPLAGFSMSVILPTVFTWTEERILPVTGKISSLYLVTGSAGSMVTPLLFGYMMEQYGSLWYVYLLLGMSLVSQIIYTAARITEKYWIKPLGNKEVKDEEECICLNGIASKMNS